MKMSPADIENAVKECILQVAREQSIEVKDLKPEYSVVDTLGFSSLDVATLTALLENTFKVDPFGSGLASITEIRTLQDMFNLYNRCLNQGEAKQPKKDSHVEDSEKIRLQKRMQRRAI
jgi:acyl carrier protein